MIFNMSGGGGGAGLNFKVVGNPKPENPKANTIWVNTDTEINGWHFNTVEPENPVPGMVWIYHGTTSSAKFNALKKNGITLNPWAARQYIDGAWAGKESEIWKDGEWVGTWAPYLCNRGDECTDLTGGWDCKAWQMQSDATVNTQTFQITRNTDHLLFSKTGDTGAVMHTVKPIDLTNVKRIHFTGEMSVASRGYWVAFHVWTKLTGAYWATHSVATVNTRGDTPITGFSLDVSSLSGNHYLGFGIYSAACYVKVEELYLEVEE